jgi:hypothetical protein
MYFHFLPRNLEDCPATLGSYNFFFETEAKDLPHPFIKQKRIAQLINEKSG